MKKTFLILLTSAMLLSFCPGYKTASASGLYFSKTNEDNGCYWETVIYGTSAGTEIMPLATEKTITRTKVSSYKNANGTVLWSIEVTATFSYNGISAKCTGCSGKAVSYNDTWVIKSYSSSRQGNSATTIATATDQNGISPKDYTFSVTIKCDKNGVVS